jgi:hypothetical protein
MKMSCICINLNCSLCFITRWNRFWYIDRTWRDSNGILTEEKRDDSFMYLVISYMTKETKIHTTALLETLQTWQALLNDLLGLQQLT